MKAGELFATGLDLEFIDPTHVFDADNSAVRIARKALSVLMMGWPQGGCGDLVSWRVIKAIFFSRDDALLSTIRRLFEEGFRHVFAQLNRQSLSPAALQQAQFYISNCLSLWVCFDVKAHESMALPQYIQGRWAWVHYRVVPIPLTEPTHRRPVFAYGLEPVNCPLAEPHLIFMGTNPLSDGFLTQIHTDLEAFETAGKQLYRTGHARLVAWLDKQPKKVHVCGMSLGGSLALLLAMDQGQKLSRVDAMNPAGLYDPFRKSRYDHWDSMVDKPAVYIQKQGNDPVSSFGVWKKEWHVLHVTPPADKQGPYGVMDHALNYAGFSNTRFVGVDTCEDNKEHQLRTILLYVAVRSFVYYCFVLPASYVIHPVLDYVFEHKTAVGLMLALVVLFPYVPLVLSCVLFSVALGLTAYSLFETLDQPVESSSTLAAQMKSF
ncbi:MAG: hypothetical protein ACOYKA_06515 [Legionellaceae bacterium]